MGAHVETLTGQLTRIVADGVERGEFVVGDPAVARARCSSGTISIAPHGHSAAQIPQPLQKS